MQTQSNLEADRRAIEALNQHDVKAALASDIDAIVSQWTDDFVVLPPAGPIMRGRSANAAAAEQGKEQMQALIPVDHVVEFEEIIVTGDYAFEWGPYRGAARPRAGGSDMTYSGKLMRILQRQPDGTWKMHRTMLTSDPQTPKPTHNGLRQRTQIFQPQRWSMRVALSLLLVVLLAVIVSSQEDELVPAPYLAAQYTAASDAPASVVMAGANEPGERLVVTGRVLDGAEPIAGASIFVFQTDAAGRYAPDKSGNDAELDPRLRGLLRTDRQGQYRYETIRPGSYNGNAAHVHYVVKAAGYKARLLDLWFEDDPILVARRAAGEPEVPPGIRNSPYYKASSDVVAIRPVARDASGVWHATRDVRMFKR